MREDELRALLRNDPVGFERYVDTLKKEHACRTRIYEKINNVSTLVAMAGVALGITLFIAGFVSAAQWTLAMLMALSAAMEMVCFILVRRARRMAREIILAQGVARRPP